MQNVIFSLIINLMMAALLMATMVYCRKLSGRIKVLQDSKSDLARIIHDFDESTKRATQSIAEIHLATSRLSENMQHKIDKANYLADDLQYMIEKGQKLSGKTDATPTRPVRAEAPQTPSPSPASAPRTTNVGPAPGAAFMMPDLPTAPRSASSRNSDLAIALQGKPEGNRTRSRAEQEIMSALGAKPNKAE